MKLLAILAIAFALMFGIISPSKASRKIALMLFLPTVLLIGWGIFNRVWQMYSPLERVAVTVGVVIALVGILLVGTRFGREVLASIVGDFLYDVIKAVFRFPMKVLRMFFPRL
jgi:hypothetical protein